MPIKITAEFDAEHYRMQHDDLGDLSPAEAYAHYVAFGRAEGRVASPLATREALLELPRAAGSALEIGPFCAPVLTGENVRYLDVLTAEQLRARATTLGLPTEGCPARIDYIGGLGDVTDRFDAVVSAHAIEHQPDLIAHLNDVAAVLAPGGHYYLIVPDKRYCFDHFMAESSIAAIVAAHRGANRLHSLVSVIEHVAMTTHNDPGRHWAGDHGDPLRPDDAMRVAAALEAYDDKQGDYIDVHAWYFTPDSFRTNLEILFRLGLTRMRTVAVYDTPFNRQEFCAILEPA